VRRAHQGHHGDEPDHDADAGPEEDHAGAQHGPGRGPGARGGQRAGARPGAGRAQEDQRHDGQDGREQRHRPPPAGDVGEQAPDERAEHGAHPGDEDEGRLDAHLQGRRDAGDERSPRSDDQGTRPGALREPAEADREDRARAVARGAGGDGRQRGRDTAHHHEGGREPEQRQPRAPARGPRRQGDGEDQADHRGAHGQGERAVQLEVARQLRGRRGDGEEVQRSQQRRHEDTGEHRARLLGGRRLRR